MKAAEFRDLTVDELKDKFGEFKRKFFNLRFQVATGQQDNTAALTSTKRDIARIKTILRERELNLNKKSAGEG